MEYDFRTPPNYVPPPSSPKRKPANALTTWRAAADVGGAMLRGDIRKTAGNLAGHTAGLAGDLQAMPSTMWQNAPQTYPTSDELIDQFGGDREHWSYWPTAFAAPGPGEFAATLKGAAMLPFLARPVNALRAAMPSPKDIPSGTISTPGEKTTTMARRVGTTGQYRGAPRGIDSPAKLRGMRGNLKRLLEEGAPWADWYDKSSKAALDLTAGRKGLRNRYAGGISVTSADTAVPSNQGHGIKAYNQWVAGDPVRAGRYPNVMGPKIEAINRAEDVTLTDKVGPFFDANTLEPGRPKNLRPTNDLWMARAFDYRTPEGEIWSQGLGEAQHRFMDTEIQNLTDWANKNKVGGRTDWTPEKTQAAIWVAKKAEWEKIPLEQAGYDFSTNLATRAVNITSETVPASNLKHMPGVYDDPNRARAAFEAQNAMTVDDAGRNALSTHANALTMPQLTGSGYYQGQTNPVAVNRVLGGFDNSKSQTLDQSSRKIAQTIGSIEGMGKGQATVGYNYLRPAPNAAKRNALLGPQRDIAEVQQRLDEVFNGSVIATPSEEGVRYLSVASDGSPLALTSKQQKQLAQIVAPGEKMGDVNWRMNTGDLLGDTKTWEFKPSAYLETIDETVAAPMDPAIRKWAQGLEEIDDVLAKEYPDAGQRNEILQLTRKALAEGGLERVRELVKKGVLPALVIGYLGASANPSDNALLTQEGSV